MAKIVHSQHFKEQQQPDATKAKFIFKGSEDTLTCDTSEHRGNKWKTRFQRCKQEGTNATAMVE